MTITERATTGEKAKAWDHLMASTRRNDADAVTEAWEYLQTLVQVRERKPDKVKKPGRQSDGMKRFLAMKFPTHTQVSEELAYQEVMGRWPNRENDVDVTLTHGTTVIHCNDKAGLKTASAYLKGVTV
jgi:hypothetical protein